MQLQASQPTTAATYNFKFHQTDSTHTCWHSHAQLHSTNITQATFYSIICNHKQAPIVLASGVNTSTIVNCKSMPSQYNFHSKLNIWLANMLLDKQILPVISLCLHEWGDLARISNQNLQLLHACSCHLNTSILCKCWREHLLVW